MAKKKPTAKDMADMLSNKPLPGQAISIAPDVDPRAAEFQQAMGSMMATPDDYYRWERDQRIAEQDAKQAKADTGWENYLDKTAGVRELGKKNSMEAAMNAAMRGAEAGVLTGEEVDYWEWLAKSKESGDYSNLLISKPKPPGYVYTPREASDIADQILADPEGILGVDPGWFHGIGENDWGGVAQYIQQQASNDPDFMDNVSTEDLWGNAKDYVKKYNEWLEGAGY